MKRLASLLLAALATFGVAQGQTAQRFDEQVAKKRSGSTNIVALPNASVWVFTKGDFCSQAASNQTTISVYDSSVFVAGEDVEINGITAEILTIPTATSITLAQGMTCAVGDPIIDKSNQVPIFSDPNLLVAITQPAQASDSGRVVFYWDTAVNSQFDLKVTDIDGVLTYYPDASGKFAGTATGTFTGLTDTPGSYASQSLKFLRVNSGETAIEFVTSAAGAANWINVKDYGATGDGITDDLPGINSAIAALPAAGGTLFFPPGTYEITGSVNFGDRGNINVLGAGIGATIIKITEATTNGFAALNFSPASAQSFVTVARMSIIDPDSSAHVGGAEQSHGIVVKGASTASPLSHVLLHELYVEGMGDECINLIRTNYATVTDVTLKDCVRETAVAAGGLGVTSAMRTMVSGLHSISNDKYSAIRVESPSSSEDISYVKIDDVMIDTPQSGVSGSAADGAGIVVNIADNDLDQIALTGITCINPSGSCVIVLANPGGGGTGTVKQLMIADSQCKGGGGSVETAGTARRGAFDVRNVDTERVTFNNIQVENWGVSTLNNIHVGIAAKTENVSISNVQTYNVPGGGVYVVSDNSDASITGVVDAGPSANDGLGIRLDGHGVISGNAVTSRTQCIYTEDSGVRTTASDARIFSNSVTDCTTNGIRCDGCTAMANVIDTGSGTGVACSGTNPEVHFNYFGTNGTRTACAGDTIGLNSTDNTPLNLGPINNFGADDATPSVAGNIIWRTANTVATTVTNFDDGEVGTGIYIHVNDANTTFDFTSSNLKGNSGADWVASQDDSLQCVFGGTNWYCVTSDDDGGSVVLETDGITATTTSGSGLELIGNELSIIRGCGDGQIPKWVLGTESWDCANDDTVVGGTGDIVDNEGDAATVANSIVIYSDSSAKNVEDTDGANAELVGVTINPADQSMSGFSYLESAAADPADAGAIRLGNNEKICFEDQAGGAFEGCVWFDTGNVLRFGPSQFGLDAGSDLRFYDDDNTNYVRLVSPTDITGDKDCTLDGNPANTWIIPDTCVQNSGEGGQWTRDAGQNSLRPTTSGDDIGNDSTGTNWQITAEGTGNFTVVDVKAHGTVGGSLLLKESDNSTNDRTWKLKLGDGTYLDANYTHTITADGKIPMAALEGGGSGTQNILDLTDDDTNESANLVEIATTGDTNNVFTEPSADKLLIDVGNNWPTCDTANAGDSATAFFSSGTIEDARIAATIARDSETCGGGACTVTTGDSVDLTNVTLTGISNDQLLIGTGAGAGTYAAVPTCDTTTGKLHFDGSGFSCETDGTGGSTAWDDLGNPDATKTINMSEFDTTLDFTKDDDGTQTFITFGLDYTSSGSVNTRTLAKFARRNSGASDDGAVDFLLEVANDDVDDVVTTAIACTDAGGTTGTCLDASDPQIGVALDIGANTIDTNTASISGAELNLLNNKSNLVDQVGTCTSDGCFTDGGGNDILIFEGATTNSFEHRIDTEDPTTGVTFRLPAGFTAGTYNFATTNAPQTFTSKTYDAHDTGNSLTLSFEQELPSGGCNAGTFGPSWDLPSSNAPAGACIAGTNTIQPVLDFDQSTSESVQWTVRLPSDWISTGMSFDVLWLATPASGTVRWDIETSCVDAGETNDPSFNAAQGANNGTLGANEVNSVEVTSALTTTGCSAGDLMHLRLSRDTADAADTLAADARLITAILTYRRTI